MTVIGRAGDQNSSTLGAFCSSFSIFNFDLPLPWPRPRPSKSNTTATSDASSRIPGLNSSQGLIFSLKRRGVPDSEDSQEYCSEGLGDNLTHRLAICAAIILGVCILRIIIRIIAIRFKPGLEPCEKLKFPSWEGMFLHVEVFVSFVEMWP
jgi:hypothetical protein